MRCNDRPAREERRRTALIRGLRFYLTKAGKKAYFCYTYSALSSFRPKNHSAFGPFGIPTLTLFDHLFIKSNISAMDRLVVVKCHTNIANRWLYVIQRKIMVIIIYS